MSEPVTPTDDQLSIIANGNPYLINSLRALFDQSGTLSPGLIEEALIASGNATTSANQAIASIDRLSQALEMVALTPMNELIEKSDLSPIQNFNQTITLAELAPV